MQGAEAENSEEEPEEIEADAPFGVGLHRVLRLGFRVKGI